MSFSHQESVSQILNAQKQSQARTTRVLAVDLSLHFFFEIQSLSTCLTSNTASPPIQLLELPDISLLGISLAIQISHGKI